MKKFLLVICALALLLTAAHARDQQKWQELRTTHFIVYYKSAPGDFVSRVSSRAEDYYNSIASSLGFIRFDFWLWDNRAKIYVYDTPEQYQKESGAPAWSAGQALVKAKTIYTFSGSGEFCDTVLPHELGHIIFREFVGFDNHAVPVWLDEGVAVFQQNLRNPTALPHVKAAISAGKLIPLDKLSRMDPSSFGTNTKAVGLFYDEAVTIIDYLISEFGKSKFVSFCQNLRDKRNLELAISAAYRFNNLKELDTAWQNYLKA
ncbi:MAG: peptidase MA family metallohydrolase [Candidatus Omnitrophota bacterium]|nr:peptidase MA family metallohydrolase [Candidatus Omnitrophota bacterium]